jgi:di/tricarboxylate transporter
MITPRRSIVAAALAIGLWLTLLPPAGLTRLEGETIAAVLLTLSLWGTASVPGYVASLLLFAIALVAKLAPPTLVFSGFASSAIWLIVSGFVIGSAIGATGLGDRLAAVLAPLLTSSHARLIGGLMTASMLLSFVMPSSVGRAVVMVPIAMALADRCGLVRGTPGRTGVAAVVALGCNLPSFAILPSNIPNMVLAGAAQTIWGVRFGYTDYLALHFPILGVLKAIIVVVLVLRLFPAEIATVAPAPAAAPTGADPRRTRVVAVLLATLALWMTDTIHGIDPAWVGLVTAVVLLLPGIGVVDPARFKTAIDFGLILFVAGALALGAIVNASGLGTMLGHALERVMPLAPGRDFVDFVSLSLIACITGVFTTVPSAPAVLTPLAREFADLTGFGLDTVLMIQVIGFSTILLPFQVGPLVVAMQLSEERIESLVRILLPLAAITFVALVPLDFLWWKLLGRF